MQCMSPTLRQISAGIIIMMITTGCVIGIIVIICNVVGIKNAQLLTNVHEPNSSLVSPGIVEVMQDWHEEIQHVAALEGFSSYTIHLCPQHVAVLEDVAVVFSLLYLEHVEEELAVVFTELPKEDQELLVEVDLGYFDFEVKKALEITLYHHCHKIWKKITSSWWR